MVLVTYLATYNEDGTIASVGKLESEDPDFAVVEQDGVLILTEEMHDELINDMEDYIVKGKSYRKRTKGERRMRFEEMRRRVDSGELTHTEEDKSSPLERWKLEFGER